MTWLQFLSRGIGYVLEPFGLVISYSPCLHPYQLRQRAADRRGLVLHADFAMLSGHVISLIFAVPPFARVSAPHWHVQPIVVAFLLAFIDPQRQIVAI